MKFVATSSCSTNGVVILLLLFLLHCMTNVSGELIISEIAPKGSNGGVCRRQGQDWFEIYNSDSAESVDLGGTEKYFVMDDRGMKDAYYFPEGTVVEANDYLVVCTGGGNKEEAEEEGQPQFGIGNQDTLTLALSLGEETGMSYQVISSVGPLPKPEEDVIDGYEFSYALDMASNTYQYTSTPTPKAANSFVPIGTLQEQIGTLKAQLTEQNALGEAFFNFDANGLPVPNGMDPVVDLRITMEENDYQYLYQNVSFELNQPFHSALLTKRDQPDEIIWSSGEDGGGKVRPKGQSSLYVPYCTGSTSFPFQLEFTGTSNLYGVQKLFLRNHYLDFSYARDWSYYRMAARFGLPHVRARKVRFFVNEKLHGLYTLLEAPDQQYVFHRNFPNYDPSNFVMYKVKTNAMGCGHYSQKEMETAQSRLDSGETNTPPYAYERGEHKPPIPILGQQAVVQCFDELLQSVYANIADTALAYLRYDEDCPKMLVDEGLVDRDLGNGKWKKPMMDFLEAGILDYPHALAGGTSDFSLGEYPIWKDPAKYIDVEHALKMIAFYAVTLNFDSPIGNGNNVYWLQTGEEEEQQTQDNEDQASTMGSKSSSISQKGGGQGSWKMMSYDFNIVGIICGPDCDGRLVDWSILQPSCSHLSKNPVVGPLLSNATYREQYLTYIEEFVDQVYANDSFIEQLQDHIQALQEDVTADSLSGFGMFYPAELTPDAAEWNVTILPGLKSFPLLPTMKARTASIRAQLTALADEQYPRGPPGTKGVAGGDYELWESCPSWQSTEPPGGECPHYCRYDGCYEPDWTVPSVCNEEDNTCYHGNVDVMCEGVPDGEQYEGMDDGSCYSGVKMMQCPDFVPAEEEAVDGGGANTLTSASSKPKASIAVFSPAVVAVAFVLSMLVH